MEPNKKFPIKAVHKSITTRDGKPFYMLFTENSWKSLPNDKSGFELVQILNERPKKKLGKIEIPPEAIQGNESTIQTKVEAKQGADSKQEDLGSMDGGTENKSDEGARKDAPADSGGTTGSDAPAEKKPRKPRSDKGSKRVKKDDEK